MEEYILNFIKSYTPAVHAQSLLVIVDDIINCKERDYIVILEGKPGSGKTFLVNFLSTMLGKLHFYSFNDTLTEELVESLDPKAIHVISAEDPVNLTDEFCVLIKKVIAKGITVFLQTQDVNVNYILRGRGFNVHKFNINYTPTDT